MNQLVSETTNTVRSSAVVSGTQLVASLLGGLFALLVALILGEGDSTDAFLAAYSAYLLLILFGATMRVSLVPLLGSARDPDRYVATAKSRVSELLPIAVIVGVIFIAAAPISGRLLLHGASDSAKNAAVESIAILGFAAICQIWAAIFASVLAGGRRFVASSLFYLASSAAMLGIAVALMEIWGVTGAAIGVGVAALLLAVAHVLYAARLGFKALPDLRALARRSAWRTTAKVTGGSVLTMVLQLNLTIAIGFVSGVTGIVSAYVYAYLATIMATGVTASTIGLVTLPGLLQLLEDQGDQGTEAADRYLSETAAFGVFLFLPVALGFACFGRPIVDAVLGGSLTPGTIDFFWDAARLFMIMGLVWSAFVPISTLALSMHRYGQMAATAIILVPIHFALLAILTPSGPIWTVIAHLISGVVLYVILGWLLLGRRTTRAAWQVCRSIAPCALLALAFVIPREVFGAPGSLLGSIAAIALCTLLYLAAGVKLWPRIGGRMFELLLGATPGKLREV